MKMGFKFILAALLPLAAAAAQQSAAELNRIAGTPLFGDVELWKEAPSAVVWRLNLNCRAEKSGTGRMYSSPVSRSVFGCRATEIRIFAGEKTVSRVDVILVNKGDVIGAKRKTGIKSELRRSRDDLEKLLRENFGRPRRVAFGEGALKRQLNMWTCGDHALVVDYADGEYLIIRIVPPESLSGSKRGGEVKVEERKSFAANVRRESNGDVFIDGVPMVDQGRKGYCVPATVERLLRYYGIAGVDMHNLAEKYKTGVGGGTQGSRMVRGSRRIFGDCGLKMREAGAMRRHTIVRNVDRGIPVLWFHYSGGKFQERLNFSLASRKRATPEGWKGVLASQKRIRRNTEGAHVALLIGYNRDTDEFAISNSWGDRYRIAWVRYADMEQADMGVQLYVVLPHK